MPLVPPRVKEPYKFICERVDTCQVRSFSQVATVASKCEVYWFFGAPVLFGHNMLDVVCQRTVFLPEQAILAPITGPRADQISRFRGGHGRTFDVSLRCALSLRIAMKSAALMSAS